MFEHFKHGLQYTFRGIKLFYSDRSLWKYSIFPMGLLFVLYFLLAWGCIELSLWGAAKLSILCQNLPWYLSWINHCVGFLMLILGILITGTLIIVSITTMYEVFGGIFFDKLIEAVEKNYLSKKTVSTSVKQNLLTLWDGIVYGMKLTFLTVFFAILSIFLPFVGHILMSLAVGYCLGFSYLTSTGYIHGLRLKQQKRMADGYKMLILGYGVSTYILLLIPFGVFFVLPGIITGGTLLFNENLLED